MIRVRTASRLHFGLLNIGEPPPARQFGGIGMMIDGPGLVLVARPAAAWSADGPLAERALRFARRFAETLSAERARPLHLCVRDCAPDHVGLGTGTQLALAVAGAVATACGYGSLDVADLARRVGRGARSAIGIHGFAHGGFLVDAGKVKSTEVAPIAARVPFPDAWPIILVIPPKQHGIHGDVETRAFERLQAGGVSPGLADSLYGLVRQQILPAIAERTLDAFGDALYEFNARVGDAFASAQGGRYASSMVSDLVAFIRQHGIKGAGQSSWGPSVFAVAGDEDHARAVAAGISSRFGLPPRGVRLCKGCNRGATIESIGGD